VRGAIWAPFIITLEYVSGWTLQSLIGFCPWDYSPYTDSSVNGFIRLDFVPVWFVVGLLFERFHDLLDRVLGMTRIPKI
jgi:uncharacterized membrane protein